MSALIKEAQSYHEVPIAIVDSPDEDLDRAIPQSHPEPKVRFTKKRRGAHTKRHTRPIPRFPHTFQTEALEITELPEELEEDEPKREQEQQPVVVEPQTPSDEVMMDDGD